LNERFEQYINGKRENLHSNFTLRLKQILWEAQSTPTLDKGFLCMGTFSAETYVEVKYVGLFFLIQNDNEKNCP
jgi:hypothetical protein